MKIIIAGSRTLNKYEAFFHLLVAEQLGIIDRYMTELVTGDCPTGPDQVPWLLQTLNPQWDIHTFPANWAKHGKKAGPMRNREMAIYADELILIWDGESKGSKNMKAEMEKLGKPVYEIIITKDDVFVSSSNSTKVKTICQEEKENERKNK